MHVPDAVRSVYERVVGDSLHRNSVLITLTMFANAGIGFVFWLIAARLFADETVGISTAMISSLSLVILLSRLGFNQSLVRYFPEGNQSKLFSSAFVTTTGAGLGIGVMLTLLSEPLSLGFELSLLGVSGGLFLLFIVADSLEGVAGQCFVALKRAEYYLAQKILLGTRILLLPVLAVFNSPLAIFTAFGLSFFASNVFSLYGLSRFNVSFERFKSDFVFESASYSGKNYVIDLFLSAPKHLVPIIVVGLVGGRLAAYYYFAHKIVGTMILTFPTSFSLSLFVEGSHGEDLRANARQALTAVLPILVGLVVFLYLFGEPVLRIFGENYVQGYELLLLMAVSGLFVAVFRIFLSVERVNMNLTVLIVISGWVFVSIVGFTYLFVSMYGIVGVGMAWITGYGVSNLLIGLYLLWTGRLYGYF